jgi:predicted nucleic acid-binding protein
VISELLRKRPEPAVAEWLDKQPPEELWTTSVVLAELLSGIALMPAGKKQKALGEEVESMISKDFQDQVLDFDMAAAREYGKILASRNKIGRPIREFDAQIAAIARVHHAAVATRDLNGFIGCGLIVIDPWTSKS